MTKNELLEVSARLTGGRSIKEMSVTEVQQLMTASQYITDLCLNEIEDRGELTFIGQAPIVPYMCEHTVETILTR